MPYQQTEGNFMSMDAARSSRSSSIERDETEYDSKLRNVESVENTTAPETSAIKGESSSQPASSSQGLPEKSDAAGIVDDDMRVILRAKIQESGVGKLRVPEFRPSGCCDCEETESDDDDLCSTSSDDSEESYNPFGSGVIPPVLPDIQLRVPMEDEVDVQRVKNALMIKGVLDVVCDEERQIVTVTGIVPASRILKKVRKVNRQARVISTASPFAGFINPNFRSSTFAALDEEDSHGNNGGIDIPIPRSTPNFVVHQHRLRPTFQRYTFHNSPHSPYLRTFSPSDLSPANSPPDCVTGDAYDHHRQFDSSFFDDELFLDTEFVLY
ncbi:uncharacterized protein [Physcomitrium patens]|uniref:HMA domain-containing protein n=2 Tax=Physcomitrium patens TaxID=3218 RepID=A0A2K1IEJ3_PHYPA|nr:uncharacterized protein LOC112277552 [Physcomitrium patens]PNR27695.1 hypothetical protein PHYPA_029847 [Physcomitrium patens]|eukprot:XP_024365794.1 uncharacterized protein LOC112277552 [Physcomitrella patens]